MEDASEQECLFVIGASAGGIDALGRLIATLPLDFSAPVVIAQHLDPSHPSRLEEILQSATALRIVTLAQKAMLAAGTVYLVPAGQHVEILDGEVLLSTKMRRSRPQPSIDLLFQTAAEAYGERLVAIILSGMGTDGAAGVRAVKEAGGIVIVQDPATAAYPALPSCIPPNQIDLVATLEAMGPLLASIASRTEVPEALNDTEMVRAFLTQLRGRTGIDFTRYKMPTILRRLGRLMTAAHCSTVSEYTRYLSANPDAYQHLVSSFLIKVTGFFRDPALYKNLREEVLPEIIRHAREQRTELRIWSAGCATGEEPYSIAILLSELLGDEVDDFSIRIFATDLDADSIVFARRGLYPAGTLSGVAPDLLEKYFTKSEGAFQVRKRVRNMTVFGEYDLGQRAPFPRIDLVLCRNVLIYFTKELQQRTLQLFAFSLREGGCLVLGKAETTSPLPQYFAALHPALKIYRRQGERLLIPAAALGVGETSSARPNVRRTPLRGSGGALRTALETSPRASLAERLGSFLLDAPIGVVLVDRNYDIQAINQAARSILGIHGPGIGDDLIHLTAALPAGSLKEDLDSAFRGEAQAGVGRELTMPDEANGTKRHLQLACFQDKTAPQDASGAGAVVIVTDYTQGVVRCSQLQETCERYQKENERLTKRNSYLQERQRSLLEANAQLTAANADLHSANDHLLISAEEAEASAEEVETLNEEMQATGEELETLNEELQATVEELNTTNDELGSRGTDLEKIAGDLEERLTLYERAVAALPQACALVSPDGIVIGASATYNELAKSVKELPSIGGRWATPAQQQAGTREVAIEYDGRVGHLVFLSVS